MNSQKGRALHAQVESAREHDHDFLKSLTLATEAILAYQADQDYRGLSEVLQSRASTYKHLFQQSQDPVFLKLAQHDALVGIEIAESLTDKSGLALAYRGLGKILEQKADWPGVVAYLEKAIAAFHAFPPAENNQPTVESDMKAHLAFGKYKAGDKTGLALMREAITELEQSDEQKYRRDVWLSGAYMRAAEMLYQDDQQLAESYLAKAQAVIAANPELVLRKEQLAGLLKYLQKKS